ncbi:hypothetical protein ACM66B_004612 [Microbotryomycetes sp. NB124-2]
MAGHAGPRTAGAFHPHLPGMGHRLGAKLLGTHRLLGPDCRLRAVVSTLKLQLAVRLHQKSSLGRAASSRAVPQPGIGCADPAPTFSSTGASMWFFIFYRARQDGAVLLGLKHPWDH